MRCMDILVWVLVGIVVVPLMVAFALITLATVAVLVAGTIGAAIDLTLKAFGTVPSHYESLPTRFANYFDN